MTNIRPLFKAFSYAALTQVLSSATNFLVGIVLIVLQSKEEFGLYSVCFAASLVVGGTASSLFTPYSVTVGRLSGIRRRALGCNLVSLAIAIASVILSMALAIGALMRYVTAESTVYTAAGAAAAAYVVKDAIYRVGYAERAEVVLMAATCAGSFGLAFTLACAYLANRHIPVVTATMCYSCGQAISAITVYLLLFGRRLPRLKGVRRVSNELWPLSRWNLLASFAYNCRSQAHTLATAPLIGLSGVAVLNASRMLIQPAMLALPVLSQVLLPRITPATFGRRELKVAMVGMLAVVAVYSLALLMFFEAVNVERSWKYRELTTAFLPWLVVLLVTSLRACAYLFVEVRGWYKDVFVGNLYAAIVVLPITLIFATRFGINGAIYAVALVELMILVALWIRASRGELG